MKKPRSVRILGKKIPITYVPDNQNSDVKGTFDQSNLRICILDDASWEDSLLHEVLHAALFVSGVTKILKDTAEESVVTALEHALSGIYSRNF